MRLLAQGQHGRPDRIPARSYAILLMALLAALIAAFAFAGAFPGQSPANAATNAAMAPAADRAAAFPAAEITTADVKTQLAQIAVQVRARAAAHAAAVLAAHTYTVRSGDTLSSVAAKRCGAARYWTGIYAASRVHRWTGRNANSLTAGQHLYLSCAYVPSMLRYAPAPPPPLVIRTVAAAPSRTYSSYSAPAATYHGGSGYQACVISRESGGRSQVMNSSGHYGLYQFDYGTWVSGGGAGADFGHASVSEQNRVFAAVYAARGTQPWSPSDGC